MRIQGEVTTPSELPERIGDGGPVYLTLAPLMHAAAQWTSLMWLFCGAKVVLTTGPLDPVKVWDLVSCERPNMFTCVGDPVAKPPLVAWGAAQPGRWAAASPFAIPQGGPPPPARSTKSVRLGKRG